MGLAQIRKAVAAATAAAVTAFTTGISDGSMSQADWAFVVGWTIVTFVAVFFIPNAPPAPPKPTLGG